MIAAVCLLDCLALEDEAQLLAGQILELENRVKVVSPQAKLSGLCRQGCTCDASDELGMARHRWENNLAACVGRSDREVETRTMVWTLG
jgi:hypothetical protein